MKSQLKFASIIIILIFASCLSEENKKAISDIKNTTEGAASIIKNAEKTKENIERLKELTPLTNEELKSWLPESVKDLKRTGYSVGKAGYASMSSVEGKYKTEEPENASDYSREELKNMRKSLTIIVIDGAGPTGSIAISSAAMAAKIGIEEESESFHLKPVEVNGIKAAQTYYKKRNNTKLMFVYNNRFAVTVNTNNIDADETWNLVKQFNLNQLAK